VGLGRIHAALRPGGLLVFDVVEPGMVPPGERLRACAEGDDWATLVETTESRRVLTRRITAFRRAGSAYRRSEEVHRLRLYDRVQLAADLERTGFAVEVLKGYGRMPMLPGRVGFLAEKLAAGG